MVKIRVSNSYQTVLQMSHMLAVLIPHYVGLGPKSFISQSESYGAYNKFLLQKGGVRI